VARAILLAGAIVWSLGSIAAAAIALIGVDSLLRLLPPLAIDADAVRGAVTAVAVGLGVAAALHVGAVAGLRRGGHRAKSLGILLAGVLTALCVALAAAAFVSAAAEPSSALALVPAGIVASLTAAAYAAASWSLVDELRSESRS
jgi:hypothetical protein